MATACNCPGCHLRRLTAPLVLIAIGALLLAHMATPAFPAAEAVGVFLVFIGALGLANRLVPRPEGHPAPASVFFPLLALVVGGLILARHALPQAPVGYWIAHYWPVLLILWGVTRLLEHFARSARSRTGLSGGEIALVVLVIVFGLLFSGAYRFRQSRLADYWGVNVDGWNPFLQTFAFDAATSVPLTGAATAPVSIRGFRGSVTLRPGPPGAIRASLHDTIRADGRERAQSLFQSAQPVIRQQDGAWLVQPTGDNWSRLIAADLTLTLPATMPATVQLDDGSVTVPSWGAALDIRTTHGAVSASHIAGDVRVSTGHDSVSLDQIAGNVAVAGSGDDLSISAVRGTVTLDGEFVGSLNFRALDRGLQFHSSRTALSIAALPGSLVYDMGQFALTDARDVSLRTRDEEIVVRDFTGPLEVHGRNDAITLATSRPPTAPITVTNRNADVTLTLPAASRFHLSADVRNGDVQNGFGPAAEAAGPLISLATSSGTIAVRHD